MVVGVAVIVVTNKGAQGRKRRRDVGERAPIAGGRVDHQSLEQEEAFQ